MNLTNNNNKKTKTIKQTLNYQKQQSTNNNKGTTNKNLIKPLKTHRNLNQKHKNEIRTFKRTNKNKH